MKPYEDEKLTDDWTFSPLNSDINTAFPWTHILSKEELDYFETLYLPKDY